MTALIQKADIDPRPRFVGRHAVAAQGIADIVTLKRRINPLARTKRDAIDRYNVIGGE